MLLALAAALPAEIRTPLRQGWAIQSSADVHESGAILSTPAYTPRNWYTATLPSTVLSALVKAHVYPDPYIGMNLRSIAGTSYPISFNFSNAPMPPDSPFRHSWWYRTKFDLPAGVSRQDRVAGLRRHQLPRQRLGERQAGSLRGQRGRRLAPVRIRRHRAAASPARPTRSPSKSSRRSRTIWPSPSSTGIRSRPTRTWASGAMCGSPPPVRWPSAIPRSPRTLNLPRRTGQAHRSRRTAQRHRSAGGRRAQGQDRIRGILAARHARRARNARGALRAAPGAPIPRLWWPAQVGAQNLYPLELEFEAGGQVSDTSRIEFGIREITCEVDAKLHRVFHINGKNILIRGAGYTFDMLLRSTPEHQDAELRYVRDMNLNAIRFEGKLEDDHFLELCDRYGILVLAGWCCCDHWEKWQGWDDGRRNHRRRIPARPVAPPASAIRRWSTGCTAATIRRRPRSRRCTSTSSRRWSGPTRSTPRPPPRRRRWAATPASR